MKIASVTELKNGLSGYLEKVQRGHSVLVTDHQRPVAILERITADRLPPDLAELTAKGLVSLPGPGLDLKQWFKMPKARGSGSLAAAVIDDREGR